MILQIKNSTKKYCSKHEVAQLIYLRYAILIRELFWKCHVLRKTRLNFKVLSLTMWNTCPRRLYVLAAVSVRPTGRHTGWHSHTIHLEGRDHQDSDNLEKKWSPVLQFSVSATAESASVNYNCPGIKVLAEL